MLAVPQHRAEAEHHSAYHEAPRPHLINPASPALDGAVAPARVRQLAPDARRIAVKEKGRILFLRLADVAAVKAEGNYVELLCDSCSHLLRESISTAEEELSRYGFVRIHRSVLVNAARVDEIRPLSNGEFVVRLRGGPEYKATRTYRNNLRALADCWLGTDPFLQSIENE